MLRKCAAITLTVLLSSFLWSDIANAQDNLDISAEGVVFPDTTTDDTYIYSSDGTVGTGAIGKDVTIADTHSLVIGESSEDQGRGFTFSGNTFITGGTDSEFQVLPAPQGDDVTLNFGGLNMSKGGTATFGDASATGGVANAYGATLSAESGEGAATLNFEKNSTVTFTGVTGGEGFGKLGGANATTINLNGGALGLGGAVTLENGSINVLQEGSRLAVANGLTIANGTNAADAKFIVDDVSFSLLKDLSGSALGDLTIGGANGGGGTLELVGDNAVLNVNSLTYAEGAVVAANNASAINAATLTVTGGGTVIDSASTVTTVSGRTTIAKGTTYIVKGEDNAYKEGILVQGTLQGDNAETKITLGTASAPKELTVDGGSVAAGNATFTIDYANVNIIKGPDGPTTASLDATNGKLDLTTSDITVNLSAASNPATIVADQGITAKSYTQSAGKVELSTDRDKMVILGPAVIGSSTASQQVTLDVDGNAAHFAGGLALERYGAVTAFYNDGDVDVGSPTITGSGNNQLAAGDGMTLTFNNTSGGSGRMLWNGGGNTVFGQVDQYGFAATVAADANLTIASNQTNGYMVASMTVYGQLELGSTGYPGAADATKVRGHLQSKGDVVVKSGGVLSAFADYEPHGDANTTALVEYTGSSLNSVLKIERGGTMWADTATIRAEGFGSVDIQGVFIAGLFNAADDPTEAARLVADSNVKISSSALVTMTTDLAKTVTTATNPADATKLIEIVGGDGVITNNANMSSNSMLGLFGYALNAERTILYVATAKGQLTLDGSDEDRRQALRNLRDIWGEKQINSDLANVIYDVVTGEIVAEPPDSVAGNKNLNLLDAIANPEGKVVGHDTLEYLNGGHLYGPTDVALETSRAFTSDVTNRAKAVACSFVAGAGPASSDAWASTAMDPVLNNRFWLGASGFWQDAKERDGFSGYKHKASGFVGGLDRAVATNLAMGLSFAYNKGDYEDKGAFANDSDIESFSVGLYGTYANPCGWFVTGHGGYTYSQNDLRSLRRDPDAGRLSWAESNFHTGTWSFGALFGYDFRTGGLVLTPSVGLNYIDASNSDHYSFLDGVATQRVKESGNHGVYVPLDLTLQYDWNLGPCKKLRLEGNVGYAYNLSSGGLDGTVTYNDLYPEATISVHSRTNARHSYKAGVGARYKIRRADIGLRYDYLGRNDYSSHRLMATAGYSF